MALYQKTKRLIALLISLSLVTLLFYYSYSFFMIVAYPLKYKAAVIESANKHKIDKYLLLAIIREESRFKQDSVSHKGAVGLMQLMPETAQWISGKRNISFNKEKLSDPKHNIDFGSWYTSYLKKRYGKDDLALAAYNGGTVLVDKLIKEKPGHKVKNSLYVETKNFIVRVKKSRKVYQELYPDL